MAGPNRWGRGNYAMPNDNTTVYNQRTEVLPEIVDSGRQRILNTINEAKAKIRYRIRSGQKPLATSEEVFDAYSIPITQQIWDDYRFQREEEAYKRQRDQELQNEIFYDADILDQNTRNINYANNQFTASQQVPAYMRYSNPEDVNRAIYGNSPLASGIKGAYNATIGTLTDPEYGVYATYDKIRDGKLDAWEAARNIGLNVLAISPFIGGLNLSSARGAGTAINEAGNTATRALNTAATNVRNTISTLGNKASQMLYGSPKVQLALPGGGTMTVPISEAASIARIAPISLEYPAINGITKTINGITKTLGSIVSNAPYSVVANGLYNNARIMADEAPVANESAASETPTSETSAVEQSQESQEQPTPEQPQQNPEPEQPTPEQPQENPNQPQQNTRQPTPEEEAKWQQAKEMDSYNGYVDFARDNPNSPYFKQAITLIKDKNPKGFLGRSKKLPDFVRKYEAEQNKIAANSGNATAAKEYKWWLGGDWHANKSFGQFIHNYVSPFNASGFVKQAAIFPAGEFLFDSVYNRMSDSTGTHLLKYGNLPALGFRLFNWLTPGIKRTLNVTDVNKSPKDTTESTIHEPVITREDSSTMQTNSFNTDMNNSSEYLDAEDLELTKKIGNGNNN